MVLNQHRAVNEKVIEPTSWFFIICCTL